MTKRPQAIAAASTALLATLIAAMPWGLPPEFRLLPPLLPFLVIHYWTMRDLALIPELLVFASGLALDIVSGGPMGYWALIYLTGYALTLAVLSTPLAAHALARWLLLGLVLAVLSAVEVMLAAVYFNAEADWSPPLFAALVATLFYPLVAAPLRAIAGPGATGARPDTARSRLA